jgi:hypothetical protein
MGIIITLGILAFIAACVAANADDDSNVFYKQQWYNDAAKEFGEDYYYPPSTHRSIMNSSGTVIRNSQHYRPVRSSTYSSAFDKLTPWFIDTKAVYNGGCEKLLERKFN